MAKIRSLPLMSQEAHGVFAHGIIFRRRGVRGTYVYFGADPATVNQAPASAKQAAVRTVYVQSLLAFRALSLVERAALERDAAALVPSISGWNLYLQRSARDLQFMAFTDAGEVLQTSAGVVLLFD